MKIHSITNNTGSRGKAFMLPAAKRERECVKERDIKKQNNYDNINTSIKRNPDARVSFKGAPFLHNAANFASDNPLVAEALFALLITCGLRPLTILATAKTEEDKEKCSYQAAKSVSSGLVGLAMTAIVGTTVAAATKAANARGAFKMPEEMKQQSMEIIGKGVDALKGVGENLKTTGNTELADTISKVTDGNKLNLDVITKTGKHALHSFKEKIKHIAPDVSETVNAAIVEQTEVNNYPRTAKNVADKLFQPIFMPLRARITISLIPVLLGALGLKKPGSKPKQVQQNMINALNNNVFKDDSAKVLFQPFSGVACHESK